jgi:hypothetical protein
LVSLDAQQEVAQRVGDSDSRHRTSHDSQYFNDQCVQLGVVPAVDDVDGLDFGHEHHSLKGIILDFGQTGPHGVSITLCGLILSSLDDHGDDLEVVEVVQLPGLAVEILHELLGAGIALEHFDVVLYVFGLVGYG